MASIAPFRVRSRRLLHQPVRGPNVPSNYDLSRSRYSDPTSAVAAQDKATSTARQGRRKRGLTQPSLQPPVSPALAWWLCPQRLLSTQYAVGTRSHSPVTSPALLTSHRVPNSIYTQSLHCEHQPRPGHPHFPRQLHPGRSDEPLLVWGANAAVELERIVYLA